MIPVHGVMAGIALVLVEIWSVHPMEVMFGQY